MNGRWSVVVACVCALVRTASADDTTTIWDGTYTSDYGGSGGQLCPKGTPSVTVKNGIFTITWKVSLGNGHVPVATIVGTARSSGFVRVTPTLLPRDKLADTLQRLGDKHEDLVKIADETEGTFTGDDRGRKLVLRSPSCSASWETTDPLVRPKETAAKKAAAAKPRKPPPPLPAGSAKWDATYNAFASQVGDWRCPVSDALDGIVVKKGRFSIPWRVSSRFGEITIGQLDGSVTASGTVKLRTWLSIAELPPELGAKGRTYNELKAFAVKVAFTAKRNAGNNGVVTAGKSCKYELIKVDTSKPTTTTASKGSGGKGSSSSSSSSSSSGSSSSSSSSSKSGGSTASKSSGSSSSSSSRDDDDDDDNPKAIRNRGAKGNGLACTWNSDCASDYCKYHICEWEHAYEKDYVTGAACGFNSDCASGDCREKKCR